VTHALRSSEYHLRNALYDWVIDTLKLRKVYIEDFSRLTFTYTLMSKRKLQWFVEQKLVEGWSDPRFPTVQGICRRGLTIPALREFILSQGASKSDITMEWDKLWATNMKLIDPTSPRFTAVVSEAKVLFSLKNVEAKVVGVSAPLHPKHSELGRKVVLQCDQIIIDQDDAKLIEQGEEITLMSWGNAIVQKIEKNGSGVVTRMEGVLHLEGDYKKTKKKVTWLAASTAAARDLVPCTLVEFDHLITLKKLEEGQDHKDFLTPVTRFDTPAFGEAAMRNLKAGDIIQLQRRGFYRVDAPYLSTQRPMMLFAVPDGKAKAVSVLSSRVQRKPAGVPRSSAKTTDTSE